MELSTGKDEGDEKSSTSMSGRAVSSPVIGSWETVGAEEAHRERRGALCGRGPWGVVSLLRDRRALRAAMSRESESVSAQDAHKG